MSECIHYSKCGNTHEDQTECPESSVSQPEEEKVEKRRGATGVWTLVLRRPDGHVIATSEWGTDYTFAVKEWEALPIV